MKVITLFAVALAPWSLAAAQAKATPDFTAKYRQVIEAVQRRDTVALRGIYADRYSFTIGGGDSVTSLTKTERLQAIAASTDSISVLNLEQCKFDLFGTTTAVGHCWVRQQNIQGRQNDWVGIYTTVIFNRTAAGRWQLLGTHSCVNRPKRRGTSP